MHKVSLMFFGLLLLFKIDCFAQFGNETITITTYYPSPYGVYRNLQLYPSEEPTVGVAPGVMYFNQTQGKVLIYINETEKWKPMGGSDPAKTGLVNSAHSEQECTDLKGKVVASDGFLNLCRFDGEDCPEGWTQYKWFSACEGSVADHCCLRADKPWGPKRFEEHFICGGTAWTESDCPINICSATERDHYPYDCVSDSCGAHRSKRIQIGCY